MSKNLTRKGLAFGALIALGASVISGAPANAGVTGTSKVTIAATSGGEVYNVLTGSSKAFSLSSVVANSLRGAATTGLKWIVEDASRTVVPSVTNGGTNDVVGSYSTTTNKAVVVADDYAADIVLTTASGETAARTVKVTAWYDDNNNAEIDADEYEATQTVNFVAASTVTSSVVVTSPIIGDTNFEGYVVTSPVLNFAQSTAPTVATSWQGNSGSFAATVSQDSTNKRFKFVAERSYAISAGADIASGATVLTSASHTLANGEKVKTAGLTAGTTQGDLNGSGKVVSSVAANTFSVPTTGAGTVTPSSATAKVEVVAGTYSATPSVGAQEGTKSTFAVGAAVAAEGTAAIAASANIKVSANDTDAASASVRYETKAASATFSFVDADDKALVAGKPVRVTATITSATGVTLNGVAKTTGQSIDLVTDASGKATVSVATTSGDASDVIVLTAVAEGVSATSSTATLNWTATTLSLSDLANAGTSLVRSIAVGGSHTFNLAITDNWGQSVSGSYRLKVATSGNTVSENYYDATSGTASVTVADAKLASGNVSVVVTPQKKNDAGTWQDSTANAALPAAVTYTLIPVAQSNGAVTVPAAQSAAASSATLVAGDVRTSQSAITSVATAPVTINGVVSDATTGVVKPGALVTVSGPSTVLFTNDTVAAYGSISFYADATTGAYSVDAISNIAQKESIVTVSSLGGSKTVKVTFTAPTAATAVKEIVSSAPQYLAPGRSVSVSFKAVDKFGNVVNLGANDDDITVTSTGSGYLTSYPVVFTEGVANVVLITQPNDSGSAVLTVVAALGAEDSITKVSTVTIGSAPVAAPAATAAASGSTGKFFASVANAAGKKVVVKVSGKFVTSFTGTAAKKSVAVAALKGKRTVTIYVGGTLVLTKLVTIK